MAGLLAREELPIARLSSGSALSFGATATHSGAMTARYIVINTNAAVCFLLAATTETVATGHFRLSADQTLYLKCATTESLHVVAADSAATGVLGTIRWADLVG